MEPDPFVSSALPIFGTHQPLLNTDQSLPNADQPLDDGLTPAEALSDLFAHLGDEGGELVALPLPSFPASADDLIDQMNFPTLPPNTVHPHSCPPMLQRPTPSDLAPALQLPMNIQQAPQIRVPRNLAAPAPPAANPQPSVWAAADRQPFVLAAADRQTSILAVADPQPSVMAAADPQPSVLAATDPQPSVLVAAHPPAPQPSSRRCRPIAPRTPARTPARARSRARAPTPPTPSSHVCTPMASLALADAVPQPSPVALPPSAFTPPTTTSRITKKHKSRRHKQPGTPVTPVPVGTPPILNRVLAEPAMRTFGTAQDDVSATFRRVVYFVNRSAHQSKIQLRNKLKDDPNVTSSQREAKVSRLYHNEVLVGYRTALFEVIGAWHRASAALRQMQPPAAQSRTA